MDFVIVGGYVYSGSSMVNDLLKECKGIKTFDTEFKLLTSVDGIIDLEKALYDNPIYYKREIALERFQEFYKQLDAKKGINAYTTYFCDDFIILLNNFLERITSREYLLGTSQFSFLRGKSIFKFEKKGFRLELFKKYINCKKTRYIKIDREDFHKEVQNLLHQLFDRYEAEGFTRAVLDQALYPACANKLNDYFPNGKMIIVDRDPRDNAVSLIRSGKGPGNELRKNLDAEFYARWFSNERKKYGEINHKKVKYFRYEELALNYEKSKKSIFDFLGIELSKHQKPGKFFLPQKSAAKIGGWKNYKNDTYFSQNSWLDFCSKVRDIIPEFCFDI